MSALVAPGRRLTCTWTMHCEAPLSFPPQPLDARQIPMVIQTAMARPLTDAVSGHVEMAQGRLKTQSSAPAARSAGWDWDSFWGPALAREKKQKPPTCGG